MVRNVDPSTDAIKINAPTQFGQRTAVLLDRQIDDAITAHAPAVDFNMAAVQSMDSAGLNWLVTTQGRLTLSNITLRLTNVKPLIEDILVATRLDVRLNMQVAERGSDA